MSKRVTKAQLEAENDTLFADRQEFLSKLVAAEEENQDLKGRLLLGYMAIPFTVAAIELLIHLGGC